MQAAIQETVEQLSETSTVPGESSGGLLCEQKTVQQLGWNYPDLDDIFLFLCAGGSLHRPHEGSKPGRRRLIPFRELHDPAVRANPPPELRGVPPGQQHLPNTPQHGPALQPV